jgi:KDO2-lipid IV(A) lauroyltransferase
MANADRITTPPLGKRALEKWVSFLAAIFIRAVRLLRSSAVSDACGALMRFAGPRFFREHEVGRANLKAAFPAIPENEIDRILLQVWDNQGRVGGEYAFLDQLWDCTPDRLVTDRAEMSPETSERIARLRGDGKAALLFGAHLANWEIGALALARHGLDMTILYRAPNNSDIGETINDLRARNMGTMIRAGRSAPLRLAAAIKRGSHVAMLVDQYIDDGVDIEFFGRPCKGNQTLARLARQFDCPIHGAYVIRLPNHRFRLEVTEEVVPARDASGKINVQATTQIINTVIEGWVRERPEQWLWLHRRWR